MVDRIAQNLELQVDKSGSQTFASPLMSEAGFQVVIDWYTHQIMKGRGYQITAGTISVPNVGDILITDARAEMAVDAISNNITIMPISVQIGINLATGTVHEMLGKSVATVSSAGDAFIPLPLKSDGVGSATTARVDETGGVTVTAELATTTLQHFSKGAATAQGAYALNVDWQPRCPPQLVGPRCFYVQVGGGTAGASYFANIDYLELLSRDLP